MWELRAHLGRYSSVLALIQSQPRNPLMGRLCHKPLGDSRKRGRSQGVPAFWTSKAFMKSLRWNLHLHEVLLTSDDPARSKT